MKTQPRFRTNIPNVLCLLPNKLKVFSICFILQIYEPRDRSLWGVLHFEQTTGNRVSRFVLVVFERLVPKDFEHFLMKQKKNQNKSS